MAVVMDDERQRLADSLRAAQREAGCTCTPEETPLEDMEHLVVIHFEHEWWCRMIRIRHAAYN